MPSDSTALGLKTAIEMIDNRGDFKTYMQNYAFAHGSSNRGPRREGPSEEGFVGAFLILVFRTLNEMKSYPATTTLYTSQQCIYTV